MARTMFSAIFLVFFVAFANSQENMSDQDLLRRSINSFSANFYEKSAAANEGKNLIMSPLSAEVALAMLSLGTRGKTLDEINSVLRLPSVNFTKSAFGPAIDNLNNVKGVTLSMANKLFVKDGPQFALNEDYKKDVINVFKSDIQNVDYSKAAEAASLINKWVEDKTNNKIKDLIDKDSIDDLTRLILVNAIYFKGDWESKFDKQATMKRDFHLDERNKVQVDMMFQKHKFQYAELPELNAKVLEMPYVNRSVSMVIILPNEVNGLAALERKLVNGVDLNLLLSRTNEEEVEVSIPKFKIETTLDLAKLLPQMGFKTLMNPDQVDLSGLLKSSEKLYISDAIQKAFIEVNEEGSEAAAATAMMMICRMMPMTITMEFRADRPFYYAIVSNSNVLFSGRMMKPEYSE